MSDRRPLGHPDDSPHGEREPQPPRRAEALLERRLPAEVADAVLGDLHVEHRERARRRGPFAADAWYWWQALTLRTGALRRAAQRLSAVRPTPDRNHPRHTLSPHRDPFMTFADLRYAFRRLTATPGFTAVAVLSLGLGIGANTAMFSLVNAVLLRELPVEDPGTLVEVYTSEADGFAYATSSYPDFQDLREGPDVFEGVVASRSFIARVDIDGAPQVVFGELISWDYFQTLGIEMALGRSFAEDEDQTPGAHPVVVLGHKTWSQRFGSDPDIVGTSVFVNGRPYTVVGVAPSAFTGSLPAVVTALYVPMSMTDVVMGTEQLSRRGSRSTFLKARLRPDVSVSEANAALAAFSTSLQERYPETNALRVMTAVAIGDFALHPSVDRVLAPVAVLLLGVVGLVLLIACTNLASFLLARAEDRRREIAVRLALGAGRRRLVGQLLVETTLLAVLGGGFGLIVAEWTLGVLMALRPPIPIPVDIEVGLDGSVLIFTLAISVLAGLAFGLLPALQATKPDLAPTLKGSGHASASRRRVDLRSAMVVTQVALSFVLLIGAGLFVRSLQKAQAIDPGFDTGPGALVWPMLDLAGYQSDDEKRAFYTEYREALLAHPSVTGVAIADRLPLGIAVQTANYLLPGVPSETPDGDHDIDNTVVDVGYFDAMGVEIIAGRAPQPADRDGEPVAVVSRAFVDRFYPGENVVGRTIQTAGSGTDIRIIGVAADTKVRTLGEAPRPYVYGLQGQLSILEMQLVVKGTGTSEELMAVAEETLDRVAPEMVLLEPIKSMDEHLALLLFPPRMAALVLSAFGVLALLLAAIGVYGVVSYAVSRRTRELGIRMSLGATAQDVIALAIRGGMRLVVVGGVVGVLLAGGVTWSISNFLFGISSQDVVTFVAIPLVLTAVALGAAWVPARRASRVDPVRALRTE